jgi:hypothetical protein
VLILKSEEKRGHHDQPGSRADHPAAAIETAAYWFYTPEQVSYQRRLNSSGLLRRNQQFQKLVAISLEVIKRRWYQKPASPPPESPPLPPKQLPEPSQKPQPETTTSPKADNPVTTFFVGLGFVLIMGFFLKTCIVASMPPDDPADDEPEVAKEYYRSLEYANSAAKVCNAMNSTGSKPRPV